MFAKVRFLSFQQVIIKGVRSVLAPREALSDPEAASVNAVTF